jgi:hypothetical protein
LIDALGTAKFFIEGDKLKEARTVLDLVYPYATTVEQLDALGHAYSQAKGWEKCSDIASRLYFSLEEPRKSFARNSRINAYINLNQPDAALELIEEQESVNFNRNKKEFSVDDQVNLGLQKAMALFMMNKKGDSEKVLNTISKNYLLTEAQRRSIVFNMATHKIANGHFKEGLRDFILVGRQLGIWKKSSLPPMQQWTGQTLSTGQKILIVAEGGIGDEIINFRFCENLKRQGYIPYWYTNREDLAKVFERHGVPCITSQKHLNQIFDSTWCWTYSMSLPVYLEVFSHMLWNGPYLTPKSTSKSLLPLNGIKIGLKSCGNPEYEHNLHRAVPRTDMFTALLNLNPTRQMYWFDEDSSIWKDIKDDWEVTLDYINQMDVIVTSCTSLAHAAGAMGKETLVLVPIMNYYVWASPGETSPWYGNNVKLFRQTKPNCWKEPLKQVADYIDKNYKT